MKFKLSYALFYNIHVYTFKKNLLFSASEPLLLVPPLHNAQLMLLFIRTGKSTAHPWPFWSLCTYHSWKNTLGSKSSNIFFVASIGVYTSKILLIRHTATVPPHYCESFTPVLFDRFSCRVLSTAEGAFALSLCLVEDSKQPYSDSHHAWSQLFRLLYCLISPKKLAVFTNSYCTRVICNR